MNAVPGRRILQLAWRQLLRDARAGELRVLFFALLIAVAASTAIGYFSARLNDAMLLRASEFLGADLVLRGSAPAQPQQVESGLALGLAHARTVEFASVIATDEQIQLASIKPPTTLIPCAASYAAPPHRSSQSRSAAGRGRVKPGPRHACLLRSACKSATTSKSAIGPCDLPVS